MNKDNASQFLPLVKALAEGKTIQFLTSWGEWLDVPSPEFSCHPDNYRIKPEPREFFVWIHNDGRIREAEGTRSQPHASGEWQRIRVREILD